MTSQRNYEASDYIGTSAAARAGVTKRPTSEILRTFSYTQSDRVAVGLSLLSLQNTGRPETLE